MAEVPIGDAGPRQNCRSVLWRSVLTIRQANATRNGHYGRRARNRQSGTPKNARVPLATSVQTS